MLTVPHGFRDEELDFIINYDIKYRKGGKGKGGKGEGGKGDANLFASIRNFSGLPAGSM